MQGSVQIHMSGLNQGDRMAVSVAVLCKEGIGEYRHTVIYDEVHLAQDLDPNVGIETWALATIMEHVDRVKAALAAEVNRGQRTLIGDVELFKKDLRVAAWPAPP